MKLIQKYNGFTIKVGFNLEIHEDSKSGDFVAVLSTHTPSLTPEKQPGEPFKVMKFHEPEEIRHKDLQALIDICKDRIVELGGEIIRFDQIPFE